MSEERRFETIGEVKDQLRNDIENEGYTIYFGDTTIVETDEGKELECFSIIAKNLQERDTEETIYMPNDASVYNGSYSGIPNYEEMKGYVLEYLHWYDTGNLFFEENEQ